MRMLTIRAPPLSCQREKEALPGHDPSHPKAGVWNGSFLWSTCWLSGEPSQIQASQVRWAVLKLFPSMLMNYRLMEIHTYICRKLFIITIPIIVSSTPPQESLLSFLPFFFIPFVFSLFSPSSLQTIFFPPCISSAVTSHLSPPHALFVPARCRSFSEEERGKAGPAHPRNPWQPQMRTTRLVQKIRKQLN